MSKSNEEVNLFTDFLKLLTLGYMSKYPSISFRETFRTIKEVIDEFNLRLEMLRKNKLCLDVDLLKKNGLFKDKYYVYGAFLAAISSYPILYRVADRETIKSAVFAKTAMVASSKVLDNINDELHSFQEAVKSQQKYQQALTCGYFYLDFDKDFNLSFVSRAENTTYVMASWTHQLMASKNNGHSNDESSMFNMFLNDVDECIEGQIRSFYQKHEKYVSQTISLSDFLRKISAKGFGKIWVDIDFCFYEQCLGKLSSREFKAVKLINKSIDLLFRSLLFYDDATDIKEDIKHNIVNSVLILGLELEKISLEDLFSEEVLIKKLEENNLIQDTISFGDMVYLSGIECLHKAKEYSYFIDVDALIFCARILRMFLLRKLILKKKNLKSLKTFLRSFSSFKKLKESIPQYLNVYYNILEEDLNKVLYVTN